jgi:hypothetical protein
MRIRRLLVGEDALVTVFGYITMGELYVREKRRPKSGRLQQRFLRPMLSMNIHNAF